eukprot:5332581-Prymnesium_polylepis.1
MSAPPAPDFACEPCDMEIPRNCGHATVVILRHAIARNDLRDCVTHPIEMFPESSGTRKTVSTRETCTQTEPEEAAEGAGEAQTD